VGFNPDNFDSFAKLPEALRELEATFGVKARPLIAEVQTRLREAAVMRTKGDLPGAIATIRNAMDRLSSLAAELDPDEGVMMKLIAERFTAALNLGDKGTAKETVNFMRHRAGDPEDDPNRDW
jgi:hypothetical protein